MTAPGPTADPRWELLDAYLDGELDPRERRAVEALLRDSDVARAELAGIERVRALVRGLPAVDPPFGFFERLRRPHRPRRPDRRRRAPGVAVAAIGAVAAAVVLILAVTPVAEPVAPPVGDLAARHVMLASSSGQVPEGYEPMEPADVPGSTAGYTKLAAYRAPDGMHLVYGRDGSRVSVFEQEGEVAWEELPADGDRMSIDGTEAWTSDVPVRGQPAAGAAPTLTVVALDGMVVTVVGPVEPVGARELAEAMPPPSEPGMVDRAGDACSWVAEGFGFPE